MASLFQNEQPIEQQGSILSKHKAIIEFTSDLLSKLHSDYLLVNRICYKVKHQYRRQRQFQYLTQFKKGLHKVISSKPQDQLMRELFIEGVIDSDNVKAIKRLILRIGALMLEMLKLKLYPSYTLIIFGIMSRSNTILDYLNKNKDKIANAIVNSISS